MDNRDCFENALSCMEKECPAPCRMILDNVADGIVTVDKEGSVAWFNRAAEQITGFSKEEVLGKPCRSVLQTDLCGTDACPLEQTLRHHRNVANLEVVITNKWGRQIPISVSTAPIKDKEGKILGAVETFRDLSVIKAYQLEAEERYSFKNIVTNNTRMLSILNHLRDLALSDSPVLLSGESGTGKELLARAIHELSRRKEGPYIAVNCGAIPDTLVESELFGYRRGAFTDAKQHKPGRFALAERGTLFLDEIGDLPLETQVKLLRVLEGGEYQPLGSTETLKANVRIITATNKVLFEQTQKGLFREDLYYRINVVQIDVPPLRQRREDIPLLMKHFLEKLNLKRDKTIGGLSPAAERILLDHDYPGNIRELENILEYATIVCKNYQIEPRHFPPYLLRAKDKAPPVDTEEAPGPGSSIEEMEKGELLEALRAHRWNRQAAADALGISRTTLWRKIRRFQIAS
jgi:PAS domain S-box-containing protein